MKMAGGRDFPVCLPFLFLDFSISFIYYWKL